MKIIEYFLVGIFAALGAVIFEIIIDTFREPFDFLENGELTFLVVFALVEELAKFIVIRKKIDFGDSLKTIIVNCFWIGLGFGLSEPLMLLLNKKDVFTGNYTAITSVILVHVITTLLTGLILSKSKYSSYYAVLTAIPALIVHLVFNYWVLIH